MKTNKGLWIALAAGVAVAGVVGFLMTSPGKEKAKKWKIKGRRVVEEANDFIADAQKKFEGLRNELLNCNKQEKVNEQL